MKLSSVQKGNVIKIYIQKPQSIWKGDSQVKWKLHSYIWIDVTRARKSKYMYIHSNRIWINQMNAYIFEFMFHTEVIIEESIIIVV